MCIRELPDIQRFAETYAGSEDVALITIIFNEASPKHVRDWMSARGYDFPVLWDDGYADWAGVLSAPMTWVLDRRGGMVFTFEVPSGDWGQEVGWILEAVLEG